VVAIGRAVDDAVVGAALHGCGESGCCCIWCRKVWSEEREKLFCA
jgi:hypothetical protein